VRRELKRASCGSTTPAERGAPAPGEIRVLFHVGKKWRKKAIRNEGKRPSEEQGAISDEGNKKAIL